MKSTIVIQDGLTQIVLTPETDLERTALEQIRKNENLSIKTGSYYECYGGWTRERSGDDSTIFVCRPAEVKEVAA